MSAGSSFLTQASPPWRPNSRIQNVFRRIGSGPQPLFYSANAAWSSFQRSAGSAPSKKAVLFNTSSKILEHSY